MLVDDAKMPAESDLPDPLRKVPHHQAVELTDRDFDSDVKKLLGVLRQSVTKIGHEPGYFRKLGTFHVHVDGDDAELLADPPDLWKLSDECDYPRLMTYPIEIHHALDVPKDGPVDPSKLRGRLPRGPNIGGVVALREEGNLGL